MLDVKQQIEIILIWQWVIPRYKEKRSSPLTWSLT